MPRNFKLTVAYDGTDFAGWQIQPGQRTIQAEMQKAIRKITGESVKVVGSGRTDSGVHALAQVANCQIESWPADAASLARAVNTFLPSTIMIVESVEAPIDFHAIRDAVGKRYRYQMQLGGPRDAFLHRYHWRVKYRLDVDLLRRGAERIVGEKDFACFQAAGGFRKSTVRDVRACDVLEEPSKTDGNAFASAARRVSIEIEADGFLYNMVRNIVGSLIEVARGRYQPEWIDDLIAQGDRDLAGQTAPPEGLFLKRVDYLKFPEQIVADSPTAQPLQAVKPQNPPI